MRWLTVKKWRDFQHYSKRTPPWIKLHVAVMDDVQFCSLPDDAKGHLMLLWAYASKHDGKVPHDSDFLQRKIGLHKKPNLEQLIELGFLKQEAVDANEAVTAVAQHATDVAQHATDVKTLKRGVQLDVNALPEAWRIFCKEVRPNIDPDETFYRFRDYWTANANQRTGKKSDWFAAWRTWVRKEKV